MQWMVGQITAMLSKRFEGAARSALRVGDAVLGVGAPGVTLAVSDYELLRMVFGRRSEGQILAAEWVGDARPYLDHIHLFPLPFADLVD